MLSLDRVGYRNGCSPRQNQKAGLKCVLPTNVRSGITQCEECVAEVIDVRFTPESGHSRRVRQRFAFDPKVTFAAPDDKA